MSEQKLFCEICKKHIDESYIGQHIDKEHKGEWTTKRYKEEFPEAKTFTNYTKKVLENETSGIVRKAAVLSNDYMVMGIPFTANEGVPETACLKAPKAYRWPTRGKLAQAMKEIALLLKGDSNIWVWGPPGSGKDAFFQAFSQFTNTPALSIQVNQDTNLQSWFYQRGFNSSGETVYNEGMILRACRDGYTTEKGEVIPYMIVLSDFDRADPRKMENFRSLLESNCRRVPGPQGKFFDVLPGTKFCFTANSSGGGDEHGRCVTSNVVDSSLLDRLAVVRTSPMDWEDEKAILEERCPEFFEWAKSQTSDPLDFVKSKVKAIRDLIMGEEVNIEFTTRTVISWVEQVARIAKFDPTGNLMVRGARTAFLDKASDTTTRETLLNTVGANEKYDEIVTTAPTTRTNRR